MREMKSDSLLSTSPTQPANNRPYLVREDNHSCRFKINSSSTAQTHIVRICCFDTGSAFAPFGKPDIVEEISLRSLLKKHRRE